MIKRKINFPGKIILMTLAFVLVLMGLASNQPVQAEESKTYIIATDTTYAPFEFINDDGEFVGIDIDILNAVAEGQGFEYELRPMGFNAAIQALESEQVDAVIAGMGVTEERKQAFDFTDTYYQTDTMFAVRNDSNFQNLEDLEGETVAVKTGTTGAAVATELADQYGYDVVQFEDSVNMYEDVMIGNSAAAVEDYPVMAYAISTGQVDFRVIGEPISSVPLAMAVPKGQNQELVQMFNDGLANIQESGEYDAILERYTGEDALENNQVATGVLGQLKANWQPLLEGLWKTIYISLIAIVIAMVLGVILGLMRTSNNVILRGIALFYIDAMRGVPLIVLSFFIYFGIPQLFGVNFGATEAGIATLSLNAAAYIAEIVRGGIQSVDVGQVEAGRSLGLSRGKTMRLIVFPQAIKVMVPSLINQFVMTLKDSSILSVIGMVELTQTGRIIIARTYQSGAVWLIVGIMYIIVITALTKLSNYIERKVIQ